MAAFIDLTNKKFGRLTVIERVENNKINKVRWLCLCDCGNECTRSRNELRSGESKSCGCLRKETLNSNRCTLGRPKKQEPESLDDAIKNFWKKIEKTKSCWIWKASLRKGYGQFRYKKMKINLAHRFSYFIHKGKISSEKLICHTCDNPLCVNPEHLYEGTALDNANDRKQRGRYGKNK